MAVGVAAPHYRVLVAGALAPLLELLKIAGAAHHLPAVVEEVVGERLADDSGADYADSPGVDDEPP